MTIKPKPRRVFIFTKEEFDTLDMKRFREEVAEISALPTDEKRKLMGRCIWYPQVLAGPVSYATILADGKMRHFIRTVSEIFPEWFFFMHPRNIFAPIQVFAQLEELLVVDEPMAEKSRISAPRPNILTLLLDAMAVAQKTAVSCGASPEKFNQHVADVFGLARFDLATREESLVPDWRRPQRKILLTVSDLGESGIQKVRTSFTKVDVSKSRAVFGFEMIINEDDDLPIIYYDTLVRFFRRVYFEIPECVFYLRANDEGLVGILNCALQLRSISGKEDEYQWSLMATPEDVFMLVMKHYETLRKMDRENGFNATDTIAHLESIFAGFQLRFCPNIKS